MTAFAELTLPYPPSVNAATRNTTAKEREYWRQRGRKPKSRVKTTAYNSWLQLAWARTVPPPPMVKGWVSVVYQATPPPKTRKRDISNLIKCTEDFLVKRGIIEDDSKVGATFIKWVFTGEPGIKVMVTEMPEPT